MSMSTYKSATDEAYQAGVNAGEARRAGDVQAEERWYAYAARIFRSLPPALASEARTEYREGYRRATGFYGR